MKDCNGCGGRGWNSAGENKIGVYPCAICGGTKEAYSLPDGLLKRPYAQQNAQRRSIYTDDETWAKLKAMGKGNASAGIREAVRRTQEREDGKARMGS